MKKTGIKSFLYVISFFIFLAIIAMYLNKDKNFHLDELGENISQGHAKQIDTIIAQYESSIELIFNSMINKEKVLEQGWRGLEGRMVQGR